MMPEELMLDLHPQDAHKLGIRDGMQVRKQTKVNGDCEVETTPDMNWHGEKFWA